MTKVLYPGSFDPITKGHMNIIEQASQLFDEVIIGILINPNKRNSMFSISERVELIKELYKDIENIKVISATGAATDLAILQGCGAIVRGLRNISDFDYEIQLAQINRQISDGKINTICLFADSSLQSVSSSMVKEIFNLGKNISPYVDTLVQEKMLVKRYE